MSEIKKLKQDIETAFTLINDLDQPLDAMHNISEAIERFDGVSVNDWIDSDQYKKWESDYEEFHRSWKNVLGYMIKQNRNG